MLIAGSLSVLVGALAIWFASIVDAQVAILAPRFNRKVTRWWTVAGGIAFVVVGVFLIVGGFRQ